MKNITIGATLKREFITDMGAKGTDPKKQLKAIELNKDLFANIRYA